MSFSVVFLTDKRLLCKLGQYSAFLSVMQCCESVFILTSPRPCEHSLLPFAIIISPKFPGVKLHKFGLVATTCLVHPESMIYLTVAGICALFADTGSYSGILSSNALISLGKASNLNCHLF